MISRHHQSPLRELVDVGMHNFHSPLEFAVLEQMENAVKVLVELAQLWGKEK